jgi:hypothetical protein
MSGAHGGMQARKLAVLFLFCLATFGSSLSSASADSSATLDQFRPGETPRDDFHLSRPRAHGHLGFAAELYADYANDPLVFEATRGDEDSERFRIVEHQLNLTAGLSLSVFDHIVFDAHDLLQ